MVDGGQTDGRGNMADNFFDGHGDTADKDQTNGWRRSMLGWLPGHRGYTLVPVENDKNTTDRDQTHGYRHSANEFWSEG